MILDHVDKLILPDDEIDNHYESRMALNRLGEGLFWLYEEIAKIEQQMQIEAAIENITLENTGGILEDKPMGLLSCSFQWYAIAACNYAQLVGWLSNHDTKSAKKYVKNVMPRLVQFRNKVAAHLALTDPRQDNEADLVASVMTQVIYVNGRVCAAALTPVVSSGGNEIRVSKDYSWSVTVIHERLIPRYWPDGPPMAYQGLKIPPGESKINISWSDLLDSDP
jgi:hypothetical protein